MMSDGLVDELHLFMFPHSRGGGQRPFPNGTHPRQLVAGKMRGLLKRGRLPQLKYGTDAPAGAA
jgi:hypothetical protein